ncbi:MAG: GNAT family N-acetyltransferase [Candidatus Omnitrophica bacterium]|nr:GNAT family N-acetyltransferase [Candidatus Omnitrophota bacterium]
MIIRQAKLLDADSIGQLIYEFYEESLSAYDLGFESDAVKQTIKQIISSNIAFVSEESERISGVIAGVINSSIFDYRQTVAYELIWFVSKPYRRGRAGMMLLKKFEQHCENMGASKIVMKHMENLNASDMNQLYERKKYKLMELEYIKNIKVAV